ncbi:hypothetical protein [Phenylobacterium sp.]|uniref:hypothetical protein n=1 Tax=Phenylobacterium sp. TaxID=1871053 RepID=UPI002CF9F927|nr:hypothetical protein [Phenylobacterium sp.]HLZ77153.1 hypothetical protein [Phenylobacterium sp.]
MKTPIVALLLVAGASGAVGWRAAGPWAPPHPASGASAAVGEHVTASIPTDPLAAHDRAVEAVASQYRSLCAQMKALDANHDRRSLDHQYQLARQMNALDPELFKSAMLQGLLGPDASECSQSATLVTALVGGGQ